MRPDGLTPQRTILSRRALLSIAGGAGSLLIAACRQAPAAAPAIQERQTARQVTVKWRPWGTTMAPAAEAYAFPIFAQRHPNIRIEIFAPVPGQSAVEQQVAAMLAGVGPDVVQHCCADGYNMARQGFFANLDPLIRRDIPEAIRQDWVPWLIEMFRTKEQGQFALPMYTGTIALYYNKAAFQKAGIPYPDETWDWNTYSEVASKLTDPANQQWGRRLITSYDRTQQRIHQAGGHYVDPRDNTRCVVTSPEALRALQYEYDAAWKHRHAVRESAPEFPALAGMTHEQAFAAGRYVMLEEGSWRLVPFLQLVSPVGVDWDIAPLPRGPVQRDTLATNDGWSIWRDSKVLDEAWEWMKFLQGDEWMEINTRATGQQAGRKSFQEKWARLLKEANPGLAGKNLKPFMDAIAQNYARPIELFDKHSEAAPIMNKAMNDSIRDGKVNVEAAYGEACRQINALHGR